MTEIEWLACDDPHQLLDEHPHPLSDRKLRLLGCACARRLWGFLKPVDRTAVEVTERYVDGNATGWKLARAHRDAHDAYIENTGDASYDNAATAITSMSDPRETHLAVAFDKAAGAFAFEAENEEVDWDDAYREETARQVILLRDVVGNPFRPVTFSTAWRSDTAVSLAKGMYESRDFAAMPILADALQDAGCDDEDVLNHCRDEKGVHVRGCWVVDAVLGRA